MKMKTLINELKRRWNADTSFLCGAAPVVICIFFAVLGILFALGGVDSELCKDMKFPTLYVGGFAVILLFALALAAFGLSFSCALYSPTRPRGKNMTFAKTAYLSVFALAYVWIPMTYRAGAFFASLVLCCVGVATLLLLFGTVCGAGRLCRVGIYVFFAWQIYLLYLSLALFLIN